MVHCQLLSLWSNPFLLSELWHTVTLFSSSSGFVINRVFLFPIILCEMLICVSHCWEVFLPDQWFKDARPPLRLSDVQLSSWHDVCWLKSVCGWTKTCVDFVGMYSLLVWLSGLHITFSLCTNKLTWYTSQVWWLFGWFWRVKMKISSLLDACL